MEEDNTNYIALLALYSVSIYCLFYIAVSIYNAYLTSSIGL